MLSFSKYLPLFIGNITFLMDRVYNGPQNVTLGTKMMNFGYLLKEEFHCVIDILCILFI